MNRIEDKGYTGWVQHQLKICSSCRFKEPDFQASSKFDKELEFMKTPVHQGCRVDPLFHNHHITLLFLLKLNHQADSFSGTVSQSFIRKIKTVFPLVSRTHFMVIVFERKGEYLFCRSNGAISDLHTDEDFHRFVSVQFKAHLPLIFCGIQWWLEKQLPHKEWGFFSCFFPISCFSQIIWKKKYAVIKSGKKGFLPDGFLGLRVLWK